MCYLQSLGEKTSQNSSLKVKRRLIRLNVSVTLAVCLVFSYPWSHKWMMSHLPAWVLSMSVGKTTAPSSSAYRQYVQQIESLFWRPSRRWKCGRKFSLLPHPIKSVIFQSYVVVIPVSSIVLFPLQINKYIHNKISSLPKHPQHWTNNWTL